MMCRNCRHAIVVVSCGIIDAKTGTEQRALHLLKEQTVQWASVECRFQKDYRADRCSCTMPASTVNDHVADVIVEMRKAGFLWKDIAVKAGHPIAVCMRYYRVATGESLQSTQSRPGQEVNDANEERQGEGT